MIGKDVELIEYPQKVDFWNSLTHASGSVAAVIAFILLLLKSEDSRCVISAVVYGVSLVAVYTMSAVYHGLPAGETKRKARLADHCMIPVLIAGTATPCALITLYDANGVIGIAVLALAWICALFGIFSRLFFFEKLKSVTITVYITAGILMLMSVIPVFDSIDTVAFCIIVAGCISYLVGAVLCFFGRKKPVLHTVFHIFVIAGSVFHFYSVYMYMF